MTDTATDRCTGKMVFTLDGSPIVTMTSEVGGGWADGAERSIVLSEAESDLVASLIVVLMRAHP